MSSLYLHIPYCAQRCVYCDFYFVTSQKSRPGFVEAICAELDAYASRYADQEPVQSIYFGGGTPSLLPYEDLYRILQVIRDRFDTGEVDEITLEINPEDATRDYLDGLVELGFNRLSIGIQSFNDDDLRFLNRVHDADTAEACIERAVSSGFSDYSVDLIFAIPDQPHEIWAANLEKSVRLGAPHISAYSLTVEPGTVLRNRIDRGLVQEVDEEIAAERFRFTMEYLVDHGYEHYEISNYAKPGFRARHNQRYWDHRNYLGFGPSAHSFWWKGLPAYRWSNVRNVRRYEALIRQGQLPVESREPLNLEALVDEYIMLKLRTLDGINLDHLEEHYGADLLMEKIDELAKLENAGLIEPIRRNRVRLTQAGRLLCDRITGDLLLDDPLPF